ncbi:MAG: hypothetical protein HC859_07620 [Bacteroidia bacterium]|nr:hypothetical protein [Bacteroidia bacterium]
MLLCLVVACKAAEGQSRSVKILAEVPVQFGVGYEGKLSNHFSLSVQAGVLTPPNSTIIISILEALGTDEEITTIFEDAFTFGAVGELGINYNFGKNYAGVFIQYIGLHAGDTPADAVESYFGEDLSTYPTRRGRSGTAEPYLSIQSSLLQVGLLYGRRFALSDRLEMATDLGLSANAGSKSTLTSETRQLDSLSDEVDQELRYYYSHYAFVPSLTFSLAYKLDKR